jgi:hypothetical protein
MRKLTVAVVLLSVFVFGACASTDDNLARESARSIGGLTSDQVTVSNVDRGATSVKWEADAAGAHYKCEADDMLRRVNCVKK